MDARGLAEFLAAARAGTFTGAAQALGVSVAHVSRQVARLEDRLGAQLFVRNTRRMTLTGAGELLVTRVTPIAEDLEGALDAVAASSKGLDGRLRVASLVGTFADKVVAPAMADLAAEHTDLNIEIDCDATLTDIVTTGHDIAIRSGPLADSDLIATALASRRTVAAASPENLEKHGTPQTPFDLKNHSCITTTRPHWRFQGKDGPFDVPVPSRYRTNTHTGVVVAAQRGLGISYMALAGYGNAFRDGDLIPVLAPYWLMETSVHVVRVNRRNTPLRVRRAIELLSRYAEAVQACEADHLGPYAHLLDTVAER